MTMRPAAFAALGVAAYLAFLAATVPASFVAQRLAEPGRIDITDARGTLWKGTARVQVATPAGPLALESLRWRWLPARLLAGRLAFAADASAAGVEAAGEVERGFAALGLRDVRASGDASAFAALVPLAAAWHPEGPIVLSAPALAWDGQALRGTATVEWRGAGVALSPVRPLGTYRLEARADGPAVELAATTIDGPLRVSGRGRALPTGAFQFSGEARADAQAAANLAPLLDLIGPKRPDGSRAIAWGAPASAR